jgi:hypothetical protein
MEQEAQMPVDECVTTGETYRIEVRGHLDIKWEKWFDGFHITHQDSNVTLLSGEVKDQSALHGLLAKIRDLGLALLSVNQVETERLPLKNYDLIEKE